MTAWDHLLALLQLLQWTRSRAFQQQFCGW